MAFVSFTTFLILSLLACAATAAYGGDAVENYSSPAEAPHPPHHHRQPEPPSYEPTPAAPTPCPTEPPAETPHPPRHHYRQRHRHHHRYHHRHPPAEAPHPPHDPYHHYHHPPTPSPSHPPMPPPKDHPMRKKVAVQGVVYCKSCNYTGVDTLSGAAPLADAVVKLECNNTKKGIKEEMKTDKNGYFFFMPPTLSTAAFHKCKVTLVSSPLATCSVATNLHGGAVGAKLFRDRKPPVDTPPEQPLPFELFTVGPFAFEAAKDVPCH